MMIARIIPLVLALVSFVLPLSSPAAIIRGPAATIYTRSIAHRDTLYVPVAALVKAYGLNDFRQEGSLFIFSSPRCRLEIQPGSREVIINGQAVRISAPADWVDGKLAVPIYLAIQKLSARLSALTGPVLQDSESSARIVLDPGHGGGDPGAGGEGGVKEKDVVLEITRLVKGFLEVKGYQAILTRSGDVFVPLRQRTGLANRDRADIFVSIHANAAFNNLARGTETFYYAPATDSSARKLALLENAVLKLEAGEGGEGEELNNPGEGDDNYRRRLVKSIKLARKIQEKLAAVSPGPDRGVKAAEFYVLKYTEMPSVLVETGFISNHHEGSLLSDLDYQEKLAGAIARGIDDYLRDKTYITR